MKEQIKGFIGILLVGALFFLASYYSQRYLDIIGPYFSGRFYWILFIIIFAISIIIVPISASPILPLGSSIWGWPIAGLLAVLGWTLGGVIAFLISRYFGTRIVSKILNIKKIEFLDNFIPKVHVFWVVVLFRAIVPLDISYFLGLFSRISLRSFIISTIIGLIPFCLVLAYLGTIPISYQIITFLIIGIIFYLYYLTHKKKFAHH
jgi:uncharacterized membrane protein YdjX (TVP38/TMEM64 family)